MIESKISQTKDSTEGFPKHDYIPVLEKINPVTDVELRQYQKRLRQYFISGNKTTESLQIAVDPVLLAPYIRDRNFEMDFPILYDHENHDVQSLQQELQEVLSELFESSKANTLKESLPYIASFIHEQLIGKKQDSKYNVLIKEAFSAFRKQGADFKETEEFDKQCEQFETRLLAKKATLIGFSELTAFQILNLQLRERKVKNQTFLNTIKNCISGLNEILKLHGHDTDKSKSHFDFAEGLVSFDKISEMTPSEASSSLSETRLNRLQNSLHILSRAYESYSANCCTIFVSQKLAKEFSLVKLLNEATLELSTDSACIEAKNYFEKEIQEFVQIIFALRLAELEINHKYDEGLHTSYFEGFELSYLSDDDISRFRTLVVVEESRELSMKPKDFLSLISDGDFVKVLAINRLEEMIAAIDDANDKEIQLELTALAIFRRNACVYQGGTDNPHWLNEAFHNGLGAPCPALWNILIAKSDPSEVNADFLALRIAIESRYFPKLVYDIRSGDDFGSHFDISGNPQTGKSFPSFNQEIRTPSGKQTQEYQLSMAEFFALNSENLKMLEIIPAHYRNDNLIALTDYLASPPDSVIGKIPVLWMVDENNNLKQVAVPISWLRRCRASLDYWRFLQELGGVNSYHVKRSIREAKSKWEAAKEVEIGELKTRLQAEFDRTRTDDLARAIKNILNALLDTDNEVTSILKQESTATITTRSEEKIISKPQIEQEEAPQETTVSSEVWVESDLCTSCSDCTDALPSVFKYNSDKLAIVHNPKGSTFAKIVATAEKCPAACIHPGLPHNAEEPGLDKLIERAKKFN